MRLPGAGVGVGVGDGEGFGLCHGGVGLASLAEKERQTKSGRHHLRARLARFQGPRHIRVSMS